MIDPTASLGPRAARRAWQELERLQDAPYNFDAAQRDSFTEANGWHIDDYLQPLPGEGAGAPTPDGPWSTACRLMRDYQFADPRMIRAVYDVDHPFAERTMVLQARFLWMRFWFGVRVGRLHDETVEDAGRRARVWGWSYGTLRGHYETGEMSFEARKWLDTGEVEFRIHATSRPTRIPNPLHRIGFRLFGRRLQRRFARRACSRMAALVAAAQREPPM